MTSFHRKARATIAEINEWIATHTVAAMASMECVYLFVFWSFLPSINHNWENFALYVSSGIIQLVALPLIMVGQRVEGRKVERRAEEDHKILKEILRQLKEIKESRDAQN